MTPDQTIDILNHLNEYASYFEKKPSDNDCYGLKKTTIILLAKLSFPDKDFQPPFDKKFFSDLIQIISDEIDIQNQIKNGVPPSQQPSSNIPVDLGDKVKTLEYFRKSKDIDELNRMQARIFYNRNLRRSEALASRTKELFAETEKSLAQAISPDFPTMVGNQQASEIAAGEIAKAVVEKVSDQAAKTQTFSLDFVSDAVQDWAQNQTVFPSQDVNDPSFQQKLVQIISQQEEIEEAYYLGCIDRERRNIKPYVFDYFQRIEEIQKLMTQGLSQEEAQKIVRSDLTTAAQYVSIVEEFVAKKTGRLIDTAIDTAIQDAGPNTYTAKILQEERTNIKTSAARAIFSPRFSVFLESDQKTADAVKAIVQQSAKATLIAPARWGKRGYVNQAIEKFYKAIDSTFKTTPHYLTAVKELSDENTNCSLIPTGRPEDAMGMALDSVISFILEPRISKITNSFTGFLGGFNEEFLAQFGKLSLATRIRIYNADPKTLRLEAKELKESGRLTPEQAATLIDFVDKFKEFSEKHQTLAGFTRTFAGFQYRRMTSFSFNVIVSAGPGYIKNILSQPDYSLVLTYEYGKSIFKAWVKEHFIQPRINKFFCEKIKLWKEDPVSGFIRFRPTMFLQKKAGELIGKLGLKLPAFLGKIVAPGFGWAALVWDFAPGFVKKILKFAGIGFGLFLVWLSKFGPIALGFSAVGSIAGAIFGWSVGGPIGAVLGFFGGGILGGIIGISVIKAWGSITGFFSGLFSGAASAATASAAAFPSALTAGITSAALPITGVFLGTTIGVNLFYYQFLQAGFNPYRDTGQASIVQTSKELDDIFQKAADDVCIPVAMLKAISRIEAKDVWNYTPEEIAKFSTDGWWKTATPEELKRGYCVDTCLTYDCAKINRKTNTYCEPGDPNPDCRETTVYGPMQFEEITWASRFSCPKNPDGTFDNDCLMKRCNLKTTISAAAEKIKANSGSTKCDNWDKDTVTRAAKGYCGSCGITPTCKVEPKDKNTEEWKKWKICRDKNYQCGDDYCGLAWDYYQGYQ